MDCMLCQSATPDEARALCASGNWEIERKFDGVRAYIEGGRLFDRRKKDITGQFPEFVGIPQGVVVDGEIIAQSGEFNDVSGRMHLRDKFLISMASKGSPAIFMAFWGTDVPLAPWMQVAERFSTFDEGWEQVGKNGWEGLVIKRKGVPYQPGKRSPDWRKVKAWAEATAEFTKYESNPRGITIETSDGRRVVINGSQANEVSRLIDKNGCVVCEIQYLPQKDSDAWRFPSFRGVV